jgi:ribosomal protein S18 acetylase RimI-like enzyme
MIFIRPVQLPQDQASLLQLDTSFHTETIYTVSVAGLAFELAPTQLAAPIQKRFPLAEVFSEEERVWDQGWVAEEEGHLLGFLAGRCDQWNRRFAIWHLYVQPQARRRGIGSQLLAHVQMLPLLQNIRCLWLETSNLNYPGIQFYLHAGFTLCGLDTSLYDQAQLWAADPTLPPEVALYLQRPL